MSLPAGSVIRTPTYQKAAGNLQSFDYENLPTTGARMLSDTLVIVPTYNEAGNIGRLIEQLMQLDQQVDVLVIDDGSPDGTPQVVGEKMKKFNGRVYLIERAGKMGLGT